MGTAATKNAPACEPISFVVAVNDAAELRQNLQSSQVWKSQQHEFLLVENFNNQAYQSISQLYSDALPRTSYDLIFFVHQDVFFPDDWEEQLASALSDIEMRDANWGVIGAAGIGFDGRPRGNWSDPGGTQRKGPLPSAVQSLDELWLGVRRSRGLNFDPALPGFHCYGMDLCLSARQRGLACYALDAHCHHKYRDPAGNRIENPAQSAKIMARNAPAFKADFAKSSSYIARKWHSYMPFASTSFKWNAENLSHSAEIRRNGLAWHLL